MVGPNVRDNPLDTSKQSPPIKAIGLTPIGEEAEEDEVEEKKKNMDAVRFTESAVAP